MTATPGIGSILYLASYMIRAKVQAEKTMPDTPDMYSADLEVVGDQGDMNRDPLTGATGPDGQVQFPLRRQDQPVYTDPTQLPPLNNTTQDIGKYWLFDTVDTEGTVIAEYAYIWYGTSYRKTMMGSYGVPGPVPDVQLHTQNIDPSMDAHIDTGGPTTQPSWTFYLPVPQGPPGAPGPVSSMPDVDLSTPPTNLQLLSATDRFNAQGHQVWSPTTVHALNPKPYSVPESAFVAYTGVSQQAHIGSFLLPPQPFDWTPIVWGHIGKGGVTLSAKPLMVGMQVLLGNATSGKMISRGMGNALGEVNIMPHYSTKKSKNQSLTPKNDYAVIPANHTDPALGTIYMNLWNDGQLGVYSFSPHNAQLFVLVVPVDVITQPVSRRVRR